MDSLLVTRQTKYRAETGRGRSPAFRPPDSYRFVIIHTRLFEWWCPRSQPHRESDSEKDSNSDPDYVPVKFSFPLSVTRGGNARGKLAWHRKLESCLALRIVPCFNDVCGSAIAMEQLAASSFSCFTNKRVPSLYICDCNGGRVSMTPVPSPRRAQNHRIGPSPFPVPVLIDAHA